MFKIIFVFILVLVFVPQVRRFLFWLIVGRQIVKAQKKYQQTSNPTPSRPEGEIKVDYIPNKNNDKNQSGGHYVDYEEVK